MADPSFHRFIKERAGYPEDLLDKIGALQSVDQFFELVANLYEAGGYDSSRHAEKPAPRKRPKTARAFFHDDKVDEVKEAHPDFSFPQVRAEIARMWKEDFAEKESRAEWMEKADAAKAETSPDSSPVKKSPVKAAPVEKKAERKKPPVPKGKQIGRRSESTPYVPRKAQSAYMFMCAEHRDGVAERIEDAKEVTKELRRMWKEDFASKESRAEYQRLADQDKERFIAETSTSKEAPKEASKEASKEAPKEAQFRKAGAMTTEKGDKIWIVEVRGCDVICSWGKSGATLQNRTVSLGDHEEALAEAQKRYAKKAKEGYDFERPARQPEESTVASTAQKKKAKAKFRKNMTAALHEEQPGLSKSEISTILAQSWDALNDAEILGLLQED